MSVQLPSFEKKVFYFSTRHADSSYKLLIVPKCAQSLAFLVSTFKMSNNFFITVPIAIKIWYVKL
jgi:hypothetical protein